MEEPERITKRVISSHNEGSPHFGLAQADLGELGLKPGDEVKVKTYPNKILIVPEESNGSKDGNLQDRESS